MALNSVYPLGKNVHYAEMDLMFKKASGLVLSRDVKTGRREVKWIKELFSFLLSSSPTFSEI